MKEVAAEALNRLLDLLEEAPEPFDLMHTAARRLLIRATRELPASEGMSKAVDDFHAELQYMTLCCELYGRDQVYLAAHQNNCREALRRVMRSGLALH